MKKARWILMVIALLASSPATAQDARDDATFAKLARAIEEGGVTGLKALLDAGLSAKATGADGWSALHTAATYADRDCLSLLLDRGADPNARAGKFKGTALEIVLRQERYDLARLLMERGSDPQAALVSGAENGNLEWMKYAVAKGAKAKPVGNPPSTPLHGAAGGASIPAMDYLLAAGADPNATDQFGKTPLHAAAQSGSAEPVRRLLRAGAKVDPPGETSPIFLAVYWGCVDAAKALADAGAPLDVYTAAGTGRKEELAAILEKDPAAAKAHLPEGTTPLHYAAQSGSAAVVSLLLAAGADLEARDGKKSRPFHCSTTPEVADVFLAKGVPIDQRREEPGEETLLLLALRGHRSALALHLLEKGAAFAKKAPPAPTSSPLHEAAGAGDLASLRWMLEHGADAGLLMAPAETSLLHAAARGGADDLARWLVEHGASVNRAETKAAEFFDGGVSSTSPLGVAILRGRRELALWLLDHGADPKGALLGLPPLHAAAVRGDVILAKALLAKGAAVDTRARADKTALHFAATYGRDEVANLLVERGADRKAKDADGLTASALAARHQHFALAERLGTP